MIVKGCVIFERTLQTRKKSHNLAWSCVISNVFYCVFLSFTKLYFGLSERDGLILDLCATVQNNPLVLKMPRFSFSYRQGEKRDNFKTSQFFGSVESFLYSTGRQKSPGGNSSFFQGRQKFREAKIPREEKFPKPLGSMFLALELWTWHIWKKVLRLIVLQMVAKCIFVGSSHAVSRESTKFLCSCTKWSNQRGLYKSALRP